MPQHLCFRPSMLKSTLIGETSYNIFQNQSTWTHAPNLHRLHVVLSLLFVELTLLFGGGVLVLLVLGHEIVHVGLSLGEFHLVHTLTGVPVEESLAAEHTSEVLSDTLEHLLDGSGVSEESDSHLQTLRRDIAHAGLDV